jgi:hypothetical protein
MLVFTKFINLGLQNCILFLILLFFIFYVRVGLFAKLGDTLIKEQRLLTP